MGRRTRKRGGRDEAYHDLDSPPKCRKCQNPMYSDVSIKTGICVGCAKIAETVPVGTVKVTATVPCYSCQDQVPADTILVNGHPLCGMCYAYFYDDDVSWQARQHQTPQPPAAPAVPVPAPREIEVFRSDDP